jgi:hypothetical protein
MIDDTTNIVPFKRRVSSIGASAPKTILERIYTAGSLALPADDVATKMAALMLHAFGFIVIDEILADGTPRRLAKGKARSAMDRPWRLAKAAFSGEVGVPDGQGIATLS